MGKLFTFSQYAEHRKRTGLPGRTRQAVSQAVSRGRLARSVVQVGGASLIVDLTAADEEWRRSTNYSKAPALADAAEGATRWQPRRQTGWDGDNVPADAVCTVDEVLQLLRITEEDLQFEFPLGVGAA